VPLGPYQVVFVALLLLFVSTPFTGTLGPIHSVGLSLFVAALIAAIWKAWSSRRLLWATTTFGVASLLPWWNWMGPDAGHIFAHVVTGCFLALVGGAILTHVMRARRVTHDLVVGACCVYVLLGFTWGQAYLVLDRLQPGSFEFTRPQTQFPGLPPEDQIIYFSYVTLTTLGYGDVMPLSPATRIFAVLEAMLGQLYLAILIARLVSLEILAERPPAS
jgi:hypothetical protein